MRLNFNATANRIFQPVAIAFFSFIATLTLGAAETQAQKPPVQPVVVPPSSHEVDVNFDSGLCDNEDGYRTVWSKTITIEEACWTQLHFSDVVLTGGKLESSKLKITSLQDGAVQLLDATTCAQWQDKSAFFNGGSVKVELVAHSNAEGIRVVIDRVTAGEIPPLAAETICGTVDTRTLSNDSRVGRTNNFCTAWLFNDLSNCMITAGHCADGLETVFFNVPISNSDGSPNFPSPEDQYAVDPASIQFENANVTNSDGSDWCYFGCFNNSTTGLPPLTAQGDSFQAEIPNSNTFSAGNSIRITGFGSTSSPVSPTFNLAQKTAAGSFTSFSGTTLAYRTNTTGGNSGSPVIDNQTGIAYGVHTNGGCNTSGANFGTGCNRPSFVAALDNPTGVCATLSLVPNDNCQNAFNITDETVSFNTSNATTDGPALPLSCGEGFGLALVNDVWYRYEATQTGSATFDFCNSQYDTRVAAYEDNGNCSGSLLECNDDFCGLQSEMTIDVVEGATYLIRVGGFSSGGAGALTVTSEASDCAADIVFSDGDLTIDATQGPDDILVFQIGNTLMVSVNDNECVASLPIASVNHVLINGRGGADTINVAAFVSAVISGGNGADHLSGGPLENVIVGGPGGDYITGGSRSDIVNSGLGRDTVFTFGGDDIVFGGDASDTLNGGIGDDDLFGGLGGDTINGEGGNDTLTGNAGADIMNGGSGNDELSGLGGPDRLMGGPGNDKLRGGAAFDTMDGGGGTDTALDDGESQIRMEN